MTYALCVADAKHIRCACLVTQLREAANTLDVVVFIPIKHRIPIPLSEDDDFRMRWMKSFAEILLDNPFDLEIIVREITGTRRERIQQVLERLSYLKG